MLISNSNYLKLLSIFGVGGAHPGGMELTKEILLTEKIDSATKVLDIGCGTGQTAAYLAETYGAKVSGIDIDPIMVEKAKKRMSERQLQVDILQGNIENITLPDNTFDLIISESVLSFVNTPKALKEIHRLLKHNGRMIAIELTIQQPVEANIEEEIKEFYGFETFLTEEAWDICFKQAGFNEIKILKHRSIDQSHSNPEFDYSDSIENKFYLMMEKHFALLEKYAEIWDYRVFICTKQLEK